MNRLRQRKLLARENRQASLHSQGMTVEKTVKLPQPKVLKKKEIVKVEEVKRGRGRPPKTSLSTSKETALGSFKKRLPGSKEKR